MVSSVRVRIVLLIILVYLLELRCGFKFFLGHTFEQALYGFPEDVNTLAVEHYKLMRTD